MNETDQESLTTERENVLFMTEGAMMANAAIHKARASATSEEPHTILSGRKRSRSIDDDDDFPSPGEFSQMSRSERKRHREKKRRGQVNAGFDDLKDLLIRIDPKMNDREEINRVDLIGRAVVVMNQLHDENEDLRRQLAERGSRDELVTMAVPYLVPKDPYPPPPPSHHPPPYTPNMANHPHPASYREHSSHQPPPPPRRDHAYHHYYEGAYQHR